MAVTSINLDTSQRLDITCRKGDSFRLELTFKDDAGAVINLTTYTWKLDVRETDTSASATLEDDAFTYNGTALGVLTITAPAGTMAAVEGGLYVYDLQSTNAGAVKTWIYGIFKVNEDITL
jgi:hypothetical protein